jgi:hypothetical protein
MCLENWPLITRGQKNSWSFVAQMNENILLALIMLMAHD